MYLISWITIGLVGGWLSGRALKGPGYGPLMDIAMGTCGAVASGLLMQSAAPSGHKGTIATLFAVMIGAALLTLFVGFVSGRRLYARQL